MQSHLRSYIGYSTKIVVFFKHFLIINILFISFAYPLSNTNEENYIRINENNSEIDSYAMQKAFEAEILVKNQEYDKAAKIYQELSIKSDDPEIAKRATQLAGYANNYELMLKSSDRWLDLAEDKTTVRHIRISIFLSLDKIEFATKETLHVIKNSKDKDRFALVYDTIKVFDDSAIKKIFDKVYAKYKNEYLAHFYYVQVLLNNNEYEEAIKIVNKAYRFEEFNKKESRWGIFLADAYNELGKKELSISTLKEYLSYSPKDLYLNQYYARILTLHEKYEEAIKHYRFMSANKLIDFSDPSVAKKMALLNIEAKKFIDATTFIESLNDKDINSYNYLYGVFNFKKNKYKKAEIFFKKVEQNNNNYINAVKRISKIKIENEEFDSLKKFFKLQYNNIQNNKDLEIRLILVETEIFFNEEKYDHSMNRINYGLEKYNDNGSFLYTRALVAEQLNRMDILENDLKKLIKLEPKNAQALNALGYTWANKNINLNEAHEYIDKALILEPNDAAILDSKGWVLYRLGSYKKAEKYFVRALKLSEDSEIISHFIQLLIKLNKINKAKKIYAKYIKIKPKDKKLNELKKILNEI